MYYFRKGVCNNISRWNMDTNKLVYVALELGSSHLSGLLAYKDALGRVVWRVRAVSYMGLSTT